MTDLSASVANHDFGFETLAFADLDCVGVFAAWVPLPGSPRATRLRTTINERNHMRR